MADEDKAIAVFASIHYVLAAERAFLESGLWCDLLPAPREVATDCGMVLEFRLDDLPAAGEVLRRPALAPCTTYRRAPDGFERLEP